MSNVTDDFVTIDFETAVNAPDSAISIGLVKYRNYRAIGSYYSLIRPPRLYIRPDFTDIHGLTVEDVKDAPAFPDIWESALKPFIGDAPLAAHNAAFDMRVLRAVLAHYALEIPALRYFCTCTLARRTWPELTSHSLGMLAEGFGIVYTAHNALDDAMTCGKLVQMSAEKFQKRGSIAELLEAAGVEMKELKS